MVDSFAEIIERSHSADDHLNCSIVRSSQLILHCADHTLKRLQRQYWKVGQRSVLDKGGEPKLLEINSEINESESRSKITSAVTPSPKNFFVPGFKVLRQWLTWRWSCNRGSVNLDFFYNRGSVNLYFFTIGAV